MRRSFAAACDSSVDRCRLEDTQEILSAPAIVLAPSTTAANIHPYALLITCAKEVM